MPSVPTEFLSASSRIQRRMMAPKTLLRRAVILALAGPLPALTLLSAPAAAADPRPSAATPGVRILVQSSPLAGFQYHDGTALWSRLAAGDALALVREPDNPHDARAVRVEWQGHKLGYLPRRENAAVAAAMDAGEAVEARIARLREHRNPWQRILIEVFVAL